jgi:hypothetical protein
MFSLYKLHNIQFWEKKSLKMSAGHNTYSTLTLTYCLLFLRSNYEAESQSSVNIDNAFYIFFTRNYV